MSSLKISMMIMIGIKEMRKTKRRSCCFLPGDAHDNRRWVTRLSSDRVIENRSVNAASITDGERKNALRYFITILGFISYLFLCLLRCLTVQFFTFSLFSLFLVVRFFCHTFSLSSDYNQLKCSCCSHYTT